MLSSFQRSEQTFADQTSPRAADDHKTLPTVSICIRFIEQRPLRWLGAACFYERRRRSHPG